MIIPGANISLGGVQIPVSQGISIPSSAGVQLPVASVAGAVQLAAGGDKAGDGAKDSKPSSPTGAGRSRPGLAAPGPSVGRTFHSCVRVSVRSLVCSSRTVDSSHSFYFIL